MGKGHVRDPYYVERDLDRYRNLHKQFNPIIPEVSKPSPGEVHLAVEVGLAILRGEVVPPTVRTRAAMTFDLLRKG